MDGRRLRHWACAAAALAAAGASAAGPRWYVQVDNDVVFATDRWYSSGVRIARVSGEGGAQTEWGLLQEVYTPEAKRFALGAVDRAPAARLLASVARHERTNARFDTLELTLGVAGPSALGEEATRAVHRIVPAPRVDWSREDRDRFDAALGFTRSLALPHAVVHFGAIAGNQLAFAHAGAELRIGDPAAGAAFTPALRFVATPPPAASARAAWNGFAGVSARAVARDRLLERGYDPFAAPPEARRLVGRLAAGIATVQPWGSATFALALDSRAFARQRVAHGFGSLTVHVDF